MWNRHQTCEDIIQNSRQARGQQQIYRCSVVGKRYIKVGTNSTLLDYILGWWAQSAQSEVISAETGFPASSNVDSAQFSVVNCPTRWSLYCHLAFCFDHHNPDLREIWHSNVLSLHFTVNCHWTAEHRDGLHYNALGGLASLTYESSTNRKQAWEGLRLS